MQGLINGEKYGLHLSAALDEEAIRHLHDVGLVDSADLSARIVARILEGILCDTCAGVPRDDLAPTKKLSEHILITPVLALQIMRANCILGVLRGERLGTRPSGTPPHQE